MNAPIFSYIWNNFLWGKKTHLKPAKQLLHIVWMRKKPALKQEGEAETKSCPMPQVWWTKSGGNSQTWASPWDVNPTLTLYYLRSEPERWATKTCSFESHGAYIHKTIATELDYSKLRNEMILKANTQSLIHPGDQHNGNWLRGSLTLCEKAYLFF